MAYDFNYRFFQDSKSLRAIVGRYAVSNWTTQTTNNNEWDSVTWSPELGLFCAVSSTGLGNRVMTSLPLKSCL